ncbi:hypothetical protein B0I35DRAFT_362209, partial [Stachybotrys elegans]
IISLSKELVKETLYNTLIKAETIKKNKYKSLSLKFTSIILFIRGFISFKLAKAYKKI